MNEQIIAEIQRTIKVYGGKMDKMYDALMGNDIAKDGGLVRRIEILEQNESFQDEAIEDLKNKQAKTEFKHGIIWTIGGAIAGALITYLLSLIKH